MNIANRPGLLGALIPPLGNAMTTLRSRLKWFAITGALVLLIGFPPTVLAQSQSSDAKLSGLTLSDVDFGTFASGTTSYTASVANRVRQTTVTPTVNHSGASYVVKLDGVEDADDTVPLSVGSNTITVEVTAEDEQTILTYTVTVTRAANTPPTGTPMISRTAQVGQTLTVDTSGIADADGLTDASFGGNWFANDTEGISATLTGGYARAFIVRGADLSYTVSRRDVGKTVKIQVYFTDDAGNDEWLTSAKTSAVAATTPAAPESLVASPTSSGDLSLSWEAPTWDISGEILGNQTWGDGGSPITGYVAQWKEASDSWGTESDVSEATVTGTTHTIQALASGTEYTTRVIAVNSVGRGTPSYEATVTTNSPATGAPTISDTAQVGQTLTASTSGISDADGMASSTFAYQWLADDTEITGATSSTYTLLTSDVGKVIKVRVTFTDELGYNESLTSEGTPAVVVLLVSGITTTDHVENATSTVATYAASGAAEGSTITWSLTGDDSDDFSISSSGALTFSSAPDHENASDSDTNNVYEVTVIASDGTNTATLDVTVTVTDQDETPIGGL